MPYATIADDDTAEKVSDVSSSSSSSVVSIATAPVPYSELTIGVLKETTDGENRVSQSPDSVRALVKAGFNVVVQKGGTLLSLSILTDMLDV